MLKEYPKNSKRRCLILALIASQAFLFPGTLANAGQTIPAPSWIDDYDPIASPDAIVGGKVKIAMGPYPSSFNMYTNYTMQSSALFSHLYDGLLGMDPVTLEWGPMIAERVEISDDKKVFTVHFDPEAKWSDGKPITANDLVFTIETLLDPKNLTGVFKHGLEKFEAPELLDEHTVRFVAKELHWSNLNTIGGIQLLPKHAFEGKDFNKENFEFPVVSGRYVLSDLKEGSYLRIKRRSDWWLDDQKRFIGVDNFEEIEFRFYPDRDMEYDAFLKRNVDFFAVYTSHRWVNQTKGEVYDQNWIVKQAVYNKEPISFQGFAINRRKEPYGDIRVRQALAHLLDRERMNETLMYNAYFLLQSYYTDLYDEEYPNRNQSFDFDLEKARRLLAEAGWKANPGTGLLENNGQPFVINFLIRSSSSEKFLVIYREALKDVGIELNIVKKDWAAWTKDMDEFNYEMTWASYGSSIFRDPEGMWHSKEATRKSGNNVSGFRKGKVDELIEKQKSIFSVNERNDILREIDGYLYSEIPYVLLWTNNYKRLLYWNKFGTPDTVLDKYSDEEGAYHYFWIDPDSDADLEMAMETKQPLPAKSSKIVFDELFEGN
ncbi:MAG: extracellular solute-binding protein [Opitutaceae bacterium]|nr:extracellular solute-binding protein [Opitutaceae bacterium]